MTRLPGRLVRKHKVRMVTVGFILVVLVQWVCGWAGFGISLLWFRRLLVLLVLACRRVDSTSASSGRSLWPPLFACRRAASGSLVTPWTRREFGLVGLGKRHRSQTRVNKPCSPGQRLSRQYLSLDLSYPYCPFHVAYGWLSLRPDALSRRLVPVVSHLTFLLYTRFVVAWARPRERSFLSSTVCGVFCRSLERRNLQSKPLWTGDVPWPTLFRQIIVSGLVLRRLFHISPYDLEYLPQFVSNFLSGLRSSSRA